MYRVDVFFITTGTYDRYSLSAHRINPHSYMEELANHMYRVYIVATYQICQHQYDLVLHN